MNQPLDLTLRYLININRPSLPILTLLRNPTNRHQQIPTLPRQRRVPTRLLQRLLHQLLHIIQTQQLLRTTIRHYPQLRQRR